MSRTLQRRTFEPPFASEGYLVASPENGVITRLLQHEDAGNSFARRLAGDVAVATCHTAESSVEPSDLIPDCGR